MDSANKQRILVTGANGFLGRNVSLACSKTSAIVSGIGHGAWGADEAARFGLAEWHSSDVTLDSLKTLARCPDVILHCAGSGSVSFSMTDPYEDFLRTVSTTAAVLEYVRLCSPDTVVVYPSSAAVYGNATEVPIVEETLPRPASPYGIHKLMSEQLCRSYATHYGLSIAIVRFFSVFGEGLRKQLFWDACLKASQVGARFHGTGNEIRDWLHVDDASTLMQQVIGHASTDCPVFNGGSGIATRTANVVDAIHSALGATATPSFDGVARRGDPSRYVADITKALQLGWTVQVDLERGVRAYVKWFRGMR